jgi:hypothetical protein
VPRLSASGCTGSALVARRRYAIGHRPAPTSARLVAPCPRSLWVPRSGLDPKTRRRGDAGGVGRQVPPHPCRPVTQYPPLEPPKAEAPSAAAQRSRHCPVARRHVARDQHGAEAQRQTILLIDESGFSPLPSVIRTLAPVGHTPILREWYTRDHLSAISDVSTLFRTQKLTGV